MNLWEASSAIKSVPQAFHEKYDLNIPFKTSEEFLKFNELLQSNDDCQRDFVRSLYILIDRRRNHIKTFTNILKKYMTRDVTLKYTAQKQCSNKLVLKDLPFCKSIIELAVHKLVNENNQPLTEKEILNGIGYCLTNAKDWDGHRAQRTKVKNPK